MAQGLFRVEFENASRTVSAHSAFDAICAYAREIEAPVYRRLHDEMPADQRSAAVGEMGFYYPKPAGRLLAVTPMREVYMGGGYCVVPLAA